MLKDFNCFALNTGQWICWSLPSIFKTRSIREILQDVENK